MKEAVYLDVCLLLKRFVCVFILIHELWRRLLWHCYLEEYAGTFLTTVLDRDTSVQQVTVHRCLEHSTGSLSNSGSVLVVMKCTQENKCGAPSCPQEKLTGALLFSRRRKLVHYC